MKSGDLKDIVIAELDPKIGLSVKDIIKNVNRISNKEYAYTTIATVLTRLEKQNLVVSQKARIEGRTINLYYLSESGYKKEIENQLSIVVNRFGFGGVKHLANLLDAEIDLDDMKELEQRLK